MPALLGHARPTASVTRPASVPPSSDDAYDQQMEPDKREYEIARRRRQESIAAVAIGLSLVVTGFVTDGDWRISAAVATLAILGLSVFWWRGMTRN